MLPTIANARSIKLEGQLDRRLRHAVARLADDQVFDETFVLQDLARTADYHRQFEEWAGDLSGRYIGTLAACAAYTGEQYPRLHRVARAIPGFQRPTGFVGTDQPLARADFRTIWGQGRLLAGLIDYHRVFPFDDVLVCARRLGDAYARSAPTWSTPQTRAHLDFAYYTQAIEGLVGLYRATGKESTLATAHAMGMLWLGSAAERPDTGLHSHGLMLTLLGLLDVHEATGENGFLQAVQTAVAGIASTMMFVDGAPPEFFPWSERSEACSIADWLLLNLRLGHLTQAAHYFEMAERVWRNALYGNQAANGGFCHRHFSADRRGYSGEGCEAWWCCSFHGALGYARLIQFLYTSTEDQVRVNFIEPSSVELQLSHGRVQIAQQTSYPAEGEVILRIVAAPGDGVRLQVRCPPWATVERVLLNGAPARHVVEAGYLRLLDRVRTGDSVTVILPFGLRVEPVGETLGSLWCGPLLMTCESPGGPPHAVAVPAADAAGQIRLPPLDAPDHPYAIAGTHFAVIGTGNPVSQPIESLNVNQPQSGRLRPLADQTGYPAPPPATLCMPIIVADTPGLAPELRRLLGVPTHASVAPNC